MLEVLRWHLDNAYGNYNYLVFDSITKKAVTIDPFDAQVIDSQLSKNGLDLVGVLITHEHGDHYYGLADLLKEHEVPVYAHSSNLKKIDGITHAIDDGDALELSETISCDVIYTPGHIQGHVSFYFPTIQSLFCGDTIFNAGVGNVKHKSADVKALYHSVHKLKQLPGNTKIYSGHDYFITNLKFSKSIFSYEKYDQLIDFLSAQNSQSRTVSTIDDEKDYNLFFNTGHDGLRLKLEEQLGKKLSSEEEVFIALRHLRDKW
jgi:hydroxyacylglutathione hydrolase